MKISNLREFIAIWLMEFGTEEVSYAEVKKRAVGGALNNYHILWRDMYVGARHPVFIFRTGDDDFNYALTQEAVAYLGSDRED